MSGSIYKLRPWLDKRGIFRVGGRLEYAPINFQAKHQILLPSNHHLSGLIIMEHHELVGYFGQEYVLASLRQRFWIVKGRATVRRVIGRCLTCRRQNAVRGQQLMASLPEDRLTPDQPRFASVGIDFFVPFYVKQRRSIVKHYGCLFTCLTIRAAHIEATESLDTDSYVNELRRFINRRGHPKIIRSDNSINLCAGEREIREAINDWNHRKIEKFLQQRNIDWRFNPPRASLMGGVWERIIRSARKVLGSLLRDQLVSGEALRTVTTEVESVLNSHPSIPNSNNPTDFEALTPNYLLLLRPNCSLHQVFFLRMIYIASAVGDKFST